VIADPRSRAQFRAEVDFDHITRHCHITHESINPTGIVPKGPELDLTQPHGRG
jgi:putative glutathione S-transferase